jgi:Fe-S cluster assembly protein SufB
MNTAATLVGRDNTPSTVEALVTQEYQWGFVTDIESETVPRGLNEDLVCRISAKKHEPA